MGMRINYNGAANNAWRNLGVSDSKLASSVEKLSSGLRINKGADDPAGLIISERLKAQIGGLGQAIQNAQEATSLVQTGEGALTEMNNMLVKMRALAVHSANAGVNDADTIAADQRQIDSALDSLQKIAQNTKYQSKILLDGSTNNTASFNTLTFSNSLASIDVKGDASAVQSNLTLNVTTAAERATVSGANFSTSHGAATLTIASSDYVSQTISVAANATATQIVTAVNNLYSQTGVWADVQSATQLRFTLSSYGASHDVTVTASAASVLATTANTSLYDQGVNAVGTLVGKVSGTPATTLTLTGNGLDLTVANTEEALIGTKISLYGADDTVAANRVGAGTGARGNNTAAAYTDAFTISSAGSLKFSLGQDASSTEIRTLAITNMQVTALGTGATGVVAGASLNSLATGGQYELSKDAANAVKIIDKAIDNVSIARATLGAFQQNALETTISTLSINKENLEASNSRITDVDMAQEMMSFTKNQILTQAGTAMLAQANQLPQSVLKLLG